jgi:hypothetical protein
MRLSDLAPRELYATKAQRQSAALRSTGPALLLDTRLWDLTPGPGGSTFMLAPPDSPRSGMLNRDTGARRGMLVVQAAPAAVYSKGFEEKAVAKELAAIGQRPDIEKLTRLVRRDAIERVLGELCGDLPSTLIVNVVLLDSIVSFWEFAPKYRCPGASCDAEVSLDGAIRVPPHNNSQGERCSASSLYMTSKEQTANRITKMTRNT